MLTDAGDTEKLARSVIDWWQLAGVGWDYSETLNDWLADDPPPSVAGRAAPQTPAAAAAAPRLQATEPSPAHTPMPQIGLPDDLPEFQQMWRAGALGEDSGSGPWIVPAGPINPRIMVITGSPEPGDTATVLSGKTGQLLDNIVRSCGMDVANVYRASFYPRVVLDGRAAALHMAQWRRIALHHIGLVNPAMLVVAGDDTARALMGHDLSQKPPVLHFLNHGHHTIKMVVTRKIALMLNRMAEEKAMAWQSWQLLLVE